MLLEDFHEIYFFGLKNRNRLQEEKKKIIEKWRNLLSRPKRVLTQMK